MNEATSGTFAVLGLYSDAQKIVDAANKIRPRKLGRLEAYTPYPVHGLDRAIGLRRRASAPWYSEWACSARPWLCCSSGGRARWTIRW